MVMNIGRPLITCLNVVEFSESGGCIPHLERRTVEILTYVQQLFRKSSWKQFLGMIALMELFLPGEVFFRVALERDLDLVEFAVQNCVISADSVTFSPLLRVRGHGVGNQSA